MSDVNASISLTRDSGYADRRRQYRVLIDGVVIGRIADGATQSYVVTRGNHTLVLKIDWCGSNPLNFEAQSAEVLHFACGSNLRGLRLLLVFYYALLARNHYLWLRTA